MSIEAGTHQIGPSNGSLQVKTGREGAMAKMGHDLTLQIADWSGSITVGDSPAVQLTANPGSIEVVSGEGGAKALSDKDKGDIKKSATGKVLGSSTITFTSSEASLDNGSGSVRGDLSIAGKSDSINVPLQIRDDGTVSGSIKLSQSSFGIKQFSAMMGALKVKDSVEVVVEAKLPTG